MENRLKDVAVRRKRRLLSVRRRVRGTSLKPRMSVLRTNKHLAVQVIDDESSVTLFSASTMTKEMKSMNLDRKSKEAARHLGTKVAEMAKQKKIEKVVFDRGAYKYHGLLVELANAAREAGLQF